VSEYFNLARYGELVLNANNRARQFTDNNEPNVGGYAAYLSQLESSRIILDDDNNIQNSNISGSTDEPYFWPLPGLSNTNFIRGGDQISNLTGIMHWSFAGQNGTDAWRIRPVVNEFTYVFTSVNPRISSPENVGGSLKVASFNVLNYFTTLNERGANSPAELDRQREKIAAAICGLNADIVGLIEIENNGTVGINDLLNGSNGINTLCGSTYAALNTGVIGTDQIAVAFIYNTATVSLEGTFAVLDSSVDPRFDDNRNRPALAQTFRQISNQGQLTVVVNHLKSKGSSCASDGDPDLNDGAANCNLTRAQAAAALVDWLATDPTSSGDPDYLIIGDLNSYKNEDPIDNILLGSDDTSGSTDDYNNLIDDYQGVNGYSYLFDGQLGYLDYALATGSLSGQITGTTVWHVNADEIALFDYNDDIQDTGEAAFQRESSALPIYEVNAFRASDHDPVLVGIDLISSTASTDGASFENSVILFPNPAIKSVTLLNRSNTRLKRATITDLSGKTIHEIDLTDVAIEKQLDISQLAPGLYFITIEGVQGMITKRLIKQ
jgi:predicted extracellular nuclease